MVRFQDFVHTSFPLKPLTFYRDLEAGNDIVQWMSTGPYCRWSRCQFDLLNSPMGHILIFIIMKSWHNRISVITTMILF